MIGPAFVPAARKQPKAKDCFGSTVLDKSVGSQRQTLPDVAMRP
jgi:hypothetical protein